MSTNEPPVKRMLHNPVVNQERESYESRFFVMRAWVVMRLAISCDVMRPRLRVGELPRRVGELGRGGAGCCCWSSSEAPWDRRRRNRILSSAEGPRDLLCSASSQPEAKPSAQKSQRQPPSHPHALPRRFAPLLAPPKIDLTLEDLPAELIFKILDDSTGKHSRRCAAQRKVARRRHGARRRWSRRARQRCRRTSSCRRRRCASAPPSTSATAARRRCAAPRRAEGALVDQARHRRRASTMGMARGDFAAAASTGCLLPTCTTTASSCCSGRRLGASGAAADGSRRPTILARYTAPAHRTRSAQSRLRGTTRRASAWAVQLSGALGATLCRTAR